MTDIEEIGKTSAKGGVNLFLGETLSRVMSAIGTMLVARLLGPSTFGLVSIVLTFPLTITTFADLGINLAITRYIAKYRAEGKSYETKNVLITGIFIELIVSTILSIITFFSAGFIANELFHRPSIEYMIKIASITIFGWALINISLSAFIGFDKMGINSIIKILNNSIKTILQISLVLLGFGLLGAVIGQTLALLIGGIIGISLVFVLLYRSLKSGSESLNLSGTLKTLLMYSLPLFFTTLLTAVMSQFTDIMTAIYCNDLVIGNFKAASSFKIFTFFMIPLSTVLLPAFSKIGQSEMSSLQTMFRLAHKYTALIVVPVSMAVIALSTPLASSIYGVEYEQTSLFLSLIGLGYLSSGLGTIVIVSFIHGQGVTRVSAKFTLAILVVNIPLGLLLIPRFGIFGVIALTLTAQTQYLLMGLWWIKKTYGIFVEWDSPLRICIASGLTAVITYISLSNFPFNNWILLMLGGGIFIVTILFLMPLIGAINRKDLKNLKQMLGGIVFLSVPLNLFLGILERIISVQEALVMQLTSMR